jgi:hypothetical protein
LDVSDFKGTVAVGDIEEVVEVAVGDRLMDRLRELVGGGWFEPSPCRPLSSAADRCIVPESNECEGDEGQFAATTAALRWWVW